MSDFFRAILELKELCECECEDLYSIEIGRETLKKIFRDINNTGFADDDDCRSRMMLLGVRLILHEKTLSECSLSEILEEIKKRNDNKMKIMKMAANMPSKENPNG